MFFLVFFIFSIAKYGHVDDLTTGDKNNNLHVYFGMFMTI